MSQPAAVHAVKPASSPDAVSPTSNGEQRVDAAKQVVANPASAQALTNDAARPEPPPAEPDNWLGMVADFIGKTGAKATYFILLVILAVLIAMEVIRLRRKRKKAELL